MYHAYTNCEYHKPTQKWKVPKECLRNTPDAQLTHLWLFYAFLGWHKPRVNSSGCFQLGFWSSFLMIKFIEELRCSNSAASSRRAPQGISIDFGPSLRKTRAFLSGTAVRRCLKRTFQYISGQIWWRCLWGIVGRELLFQFVRKSCFARENVVKGMNRGAVPQEHWSRKMYEWRMHFGYEGMHFGYAPAGAYIFASECNLLAAYIARNVWTHTWSEAVGISWARGCVVVFVS